MRLMFSREKFGLTLECKKTLVVDTNECIHKPLCQFIQGMRSACIMIGCIASLSSSIAFAQSDQNITEYTSTEFESQENSPSQDRGANGAGLISTSTSTTASLATSVLTDTSISTSALNYTFLGPDSDGYTFKLLHLALSKTIPEYGAFNLNVSTPMNEARALKSITSKYYERPIRRFESTPETLQHPLLRTVPFPVYLGVFSYRICVVNKSLSTPFAKIDSADALSPFSFGVVDGWRDISIFEKNQLRIRKGASKNRVYQQIDNNRVDVFCRAVTELPWEETLFSTLSNVEVNKNIALFYQMPFFYSTHSDDVDVAERIYQGLTRAFSDGSLMALWDEYHDRADIEQNLKNRRVIHLQNLLSEELNSKITPYIQIFSTNAESNEANIGQQ